MPGTRSSRKRISSPSRPRRHVIVPATAAEIIRGVGATAADLRLVRRILDEMKGTPRKATARSSRRSSCPVPSAKVAGPPRVFLNVPFDADFQPLFLALIAGVVVLGGQPTCALQVADAGRGRLHRILDLIEGCELSIHDLSRIQISRGTRVPRFNMPFELGICCAIARIGGRHDFYVFEEKSYRLQRSLSDLGGYDPQVHGGTQLGVARSLLNCMAANTRAPRPEQMTALARKLGVAARELANRSGARSIYEPHIFRQIAAGAAELAREAGLID